MKKLFTIFLFIYKISYSQNTAVNGIINSYTPVISLNKCENKILVEDGTSFKIGDTVLLIQMKGALIDSSNSSAFGSVLKYNNAGNYEFNYVKSKSGNIIELMNNLTRNYDIPFGKVQLIRVPYYESARVTSKLTCLPWDGNKGGVLVFNVQDTLNLESNIDVSGLGFRGGQVINTNFNNVNCFTNNYYYPSSSNILAAPRGESISTVGPNRILGKGALASGGGGGLDHNSGGGGGGNISQGGLGGYQLLDCGNSPYDNRGIGGKGLLTDNALNKIYLGGGGGAGHCNNGFYNTAANANFSGAAGGGIIIITSKYLKCNGNSITSNGDSAYNPIFTNELGHDGKGGGGAGGSILIDNNIFLDTIKVSIKGGNGADLWTTANFSKVGPGGGGAGGILWLKQSSNIANIIVNNQGGMHGIVKYANDPWGATAGQIGTTFFDLKIPIDTSAFKKNIDSVRISDNLSSCQTVDFSGLAFTRTATIAQWNWSFGDNATATTQNTTHTYATSGTYSVKLIATDINGCRDSVTKNVTITNAISFDFSYKQDICNPLSVQFFNIGATPSDSYWSFGDGKSVSGNSSPTNLYATTGNYIVKYSIQNGACSDTVTKNISVNILSADIITTPDTTICFKSTKQIRTIPALNFCWSPTTFLNDPNSPNPITSATRPITYYFTAEMAGTNLITNGNFSAGNSGFTSQYNFATPNITEGQYYVAASPQAWNSSLSNCPDHTTGSGNMMLVNGAPIADINVWTQTVAVVPNTNYAFSTWIQALFTPNPAQLSFSINGGNLGNLITASLPTCTWNQFYTTWNSGNNTSATISIVNKNTFVQGNDFALDDISFSPVLIKRDSIKITIDTPRVKAIADTAICTGKSVQLNATGAILYNWAPSTGLNNNNIPDPIASVTANTQFIVKGTNSNGCTASDTMNVTIKPQPVITKSADSTICRNVPVQIFASGGASYSWSPNATLSSPTISNPIASPSSNTTYTVTVTGANSCSKSDSIRITLKPLPVFSVSPDKATCVKNNIALSASGGNSYLWSPASLVNNPGSNSPVANITATTTFSVKIKDNTCNDSTTLSTTVSISQPPVIGAFKSNDIDCAFSSTQLSASGANSYVWSPATGLNNSNIANPIASLTAPQQYIVTGTDTSTMCSGTATISIAVKPPFPPSFFIPKAFTPNGDGLNDCFRVKDFGTVKSVDVSIYNRLGNRVFHTLISNDCWDGTYKGLPAEPGNYVYYIKAYNDCGENTRKGNLLLVR